MQTGEPSPRYAIYFVPDAATMLYRFGASVLGYDCYSGDEAPFLGGVPETWAAITEEPRKYGFHATLKAPFYLTNSASEDDLKIALAEFARRQAAIAAGKIVVREIGSFVALVPDVPCPALNRLADGCVETFDEFRAPMTAHERERRMAAKLSPRQLENLDRWGYPYVFADFRFHMTLSGSLAPGQRPAVLQFLRERFDQLSGIDRLMLDQVVIARQTSSARFKILHCAALADFS